MLQGLNRSVGVSHRIKYGDENLAHRRPFRIGLTIWINETAARPFQAPCSQFRALPRRRGLAIVKQPQRVSWRLQYQRGKHEEGSHIECGHVPVGRCGCCSDADAKPTQSTERHSCSPGHRTGQSHNPAVAATSNANDTTAPAKGSNSFTEAQAKDRIGQRGYSNVSDLKKDDAGIWRGHAQHAGSDVQVWLDYKGNVGEVQ